MVVSSTSIGRINVCTGLFALSIQTTVKVSKNQQTEQVHDQQLHHITRNTKNGGNILQKNFRKRAKNLKSL